MPTPDVGEVEWGRESILQVPNKAKDHPALRIQRHREVKVELVGAAVVAFAFDDVEGAAEEEVFGCGSDGEGVGVVVAWAVVAAAFGGVVACSGNFRPGGPMKGCGDGCDTTVDR